MTRINRRIFLAGILSFMFFFSFFQSSQAGFFDWFKWFKKSEQQRPTETTIPIIIKDKGSSQKSSSKSFSSSSKTNNPKPSSTSSKDKLCAQVVTSAKNKITGECKEFSNACIPSGWEKVGVCTMSKSNSSKSSSSISSSASKSNNSVSKSSSANNTATIINILVVLLNFQDSPSAPFSSEQAKSIIFDGQIQKLYQEQSYNKAKLYGTILGWHTLSRDGDPGGTCKYPTVGEVEIQDLIANSGVDPANYRHLVLVYNHPCMMSPAGSGAGIQQLQIKGVSYQLSQIGVNARNYLRSQNLPFRWTDFDYVFSHELGHGLGLNHAELWECGVGVTFGGDNCKELGYGNNFDLMGHSIYGLHFNAIIKDGLDWFDSSSLLTIVSSGRYTLFPYEGNNGFRAAKIKAPGRDEYPFYLEYRQPLGFDAGINNSTAVSNTEGLLVNWKSGVDKVIGVKTSEYISNLLDFNPESSDSSNDANDIALKVGQSFFVKDSGITIGPIINADASGITFDVKLENVPCARHLPNKSSFSWPIKSGETVFLSTDIYNEDGFTCNQSDFEYSLVAPQGWSTKINLTNRFTLAPGASHRPGYLITAPSNIAKGSYPVEINITNLTTGASGKFTTLNLVVQ